MIVSLFLIVTISEFFVQRYFVYNAFVTLEKEDAENDMNRITQALDNEITHLNNLNNDWATWDDSYSFVDNKNDKFIESNLSDYIFSQTGLDVIYIVDNKMNVVWGKIYDKYKKSEVFLDEIPNDLFPENHPLLIGDYRENNLPSVRKTGIFNTEKGPLLVSIELILTSKGKGPPNGYMIMGIFINEELINKIIDQTKVSFEIIYLYNEPQVIPYQEVIEGLEETILYFEIDETNNDSYNLYKYYRDIEKNPSFIIKSKFPRSISVHGKKVIAFATIYLIATGVIVLFVIILLVNRYAVNPLYVLDKHMIEIIKKNDFSIRIKSNRNDEIGDLSNAFDFFIGKIEAQKKQLEDLSTIDGLTNIANRRKFDCTLMSEFERHKRFRSTIALLLIDVDYFKLYNDFYGHQAGDECLKKIGALLEKYSKRAGELAARYGGEEFVLIYSNCKKEDVLNISNNLIQDVKALNIEHKKSEITDHVTFSIGIALYVPEIGDDPSVIIKMADEALYKSKNKGRNRATLYQDLQEV